MVVRIRRNLSPRPYRLNSSAGGVSGAGGMTRRGGRMRKGGRSSSRSTPGRYCSARRTSSSFSMPSSSNMWSAVVVRLPAQGVQPGGERRPWATRRTPRRPGPGCPPGSPPPRRRPPGRAPGSPPRARPAGGTWGPGRGKGTGVSSSASGSSSGGGAGRPFLPGKRTTLLPVPFRRPARCSGGRSCWGMTGRGMVSVVQAALTAVPVFGQNFLQGEFRHGIAIRYSVRRPDPSA